MSYLGTFANENFHNLDTFGCQITKTVVEGYVEGRRGRPLKQYIYIDKVKQWTQLSQSQCVRAAEDRSRWKQLVSQAMVANDHT